MNGSVPSGRLTGGDYTFVAVVLTAAIALRCYGMTAQSLWIDEINIVRLSRYDSFAAFIDAIKLEPHPPLFLFAMRWWTDLFGYAAGTIRLFSVVVSVVTIVPFYWLLRRRFGFATAALATVMLAFVPVAQFEAHNARPYTLVMLWGVVTVPYFLDLCAAMSGRTAAPALPRGLVALVVLNLLLGFTHYSGVLFIAAQCLVLFYLYLRNPQRRVVRDFIWIAAVGASIAPAFGWLLFTLSDLSSRIGGDADYNSNSLVEYISPIRSFLGFPGLVPVLLLPIALGLTDLRKFWGGIGDLFRRDHVFGLTLAVGLLHYVLAYIGALAQPSWAQNKMIYVAFPALYIAFARYLEATGCGTARMRSVVYMLAGIGIVTYLVTGYPQVKSGYTDPWQEQEREGARKLVSLARDGDLLLIGSVSLNGAWVQPTLEYVEVIEPALTLPDGAIVEVYPPEKEYAETPQETLARRTAVLRQGLGRIGVDAQRLLIDLPHRDTLGVEELALLRDSGYCVRRYAFFEHRVIVVDPDPRACLMPN